MAFLAASDITDSLIKPVVDDDSTYLDRGDEALKNLANRIGFDIADMPTGDDLPYEIKKFLQYQVGFEVCVDKSGINVEQQASQGILEDPYSEKLKFYSKELRILASSINKQIFLGTADLPSEYSEEMFQFDRG